MAITFTNTIQSHMEDIGNLWVLKTHNVIFEVDESPVESLNEFTNKKHIGFNYNPDSEDVSDTYLKKLNLDYFTYNSDTRTGTGVFLYNVSTIPSGMNSQELNNLTVYYDTDTQLFCDNKTIDCESDDVHHTITV